MDQGERPLFALGRKKEGMRRSHVVHGHLHVFSIRLRSSRYGGNRDTGRRGREGRTRNRGGRLGEKRKKQARGTLPRCGRWRFIQRTFVIDKVFLSAIPYSVLRTVGSFSPARRDRVLSRNSRPGSSAGHPCTDRPLSAHFCKALFFRNAGPTIVFPVPPLRSSPLFHSFNLAALYKESLPYLSLLLFSSYPAVPRRHATPVSSPVSNSFRSPTSRQVRLENAGSVENSKGERER